MQRKRTRDHLLAIRNELVASYHDALEAADAELEALGIEDPTRAVETWAACMAARFSAARKRELSAALAALERLDAGSYGTCTACDGAIELLRLRQAPTAERCATCEQAIPRPTREGGPPPRTSTPGAPAGDGQGGSRRAIARRHGTS